jgi:hypothetical protein
VTENSSGTVHEDKLLSVHKKVRVRSETSLHLSTYIRIEPHANFCHVLSSSGIPQGLSDRTIFESDNQLLFLPSFLIRNVSVLFAFVSVFSQVSFLSNYFLPVYFLFFLFSPFLSETVAQNHYPWTSSNSQV